MFAERPLYYLGSRSEPTGVTGGPECGRSAVYFTRTPFRVSGPGLHYSRRSSTTHSPVILRRARLDSHRLVRTTNGVSCYQSGAISDHTSTATSTGTTRLTGLQVNFCSQLNASRGPGAAEAAVDDNDMLPTPGLHMWHRRSSSGRWSLWLPSRCGGPVRRALQAMLCYHK